MHLTFWGVRGSCPVPGSSTVRYGGNTPCTEIVAEDGTRVILDAGTGIRALGKALSRQGFQSGEGTAQLLLSHTHHDHIHGLPFFEPLYVQGNHIDIVGPELPDRSLESVVAGWMGSAYHPTPLEDLLADIRFVGFNAGDLREVGGVRITAAMLNHGSLTNAYRIEEHGLAVGYVTDTGSFDGPLLVPDAVRPPGDDDVVLGDLRQGLVDLLRNCACVLYDTMFSVEELRQKPTWGHATAEEALDICREAGARQLVLFHHGPDSLDDELDLRVASARALANGLMVSGAREGETMVLR
jgi:phosphoribosyl 1,2-cyclic phosphodiesterase